MQYYEPSTTTRYTAFQLKSRDQFDEDIREILGIYPLADEQPEHDTKLQQLTNERIEQVGDDAENGFRIVWDIEYLEPAAVEGELLNRIAERRYNEEIRGIEWEKHSVDTTRDSQSKITNELLAIDKNLRTDGNAWKMKSGDFVVLTNDQFTAMATAVHMHVSAIFDREAAIQQLIKDADTAQAKHEAFTAAINKGWGNAAD
jgi:hypothetical protein